MLTALWWIAFMATLTVGVALNSMLVLVVMIGPLMTLHLWLVLKATA